MKRFLVAVALLVTLTVCGFAAWRYFPPGQTYLTDASTIREPAATAQVRDILWEPPVPHAELINAGETYEPRLSNDGATLYFVRGKAGNNADLYFSKRTSQGWSVPQSIIEINSPADDLGPEISADGESLYFYSNRAGGQGGYDLWVSRRGTESAWREPTNLGPEVNSQFNDYGPALTGDGRILYFSSNRPLPGDDRQPDPGAWQATLREEFFTRTYDLFAAALTDSGAGKAEALTTLNTSHNEGAPAVSSFGDFLYFASDRPDGSGGFDLYRSRRLRNELQAPINLGSAVNTTFHELDPALSMNGFGLDFSSDRPLAGQAAQSAREYKLYHTNSREVFSEVERADRAPIDWAAIWRAVGPNLLWALLALALLLIMLLLFKGGQNRKLNLLTKCVLASLAAHLLLMLLFNVWEVAASVAGEIRAGGGGGIRVALTPSGGGGITAQLGGSLSEITAPQAHIESIRASFIAESISRPASIDIPLQKAALEISSVTTMRMSVLEADVPSRDSIPDLAPQVDLSSPHSVALNVPFLPSAAPTSEAALQFGSAAASIARQQSSLVIPAESSGGSVVAAPARAQLPVSASQALAGLIGIVSSDPATGGSGMQDGGIDLPIVPAGNSYRVLLAADLPEAPVSDGAATEAGIAGPAMNMSGAARQAIVDRLEGSAIGHRTEGVPALAASNLAGTGPSIFAPGTSLAARDADVHAGLGIAEYAGSGASGTGQIPWTAAAGQLAKGAPLNLALPGDAAPVLSTSTSPAQSERSGSESMRTGMPSAARAALRNEIGGPSPLSSSTAGPSGNSFPRADVFSSIGSGERASLIGSKSASAIASLVRDTDSAPSHAAGASRSEGDPLPSFAPTSGPANFDLLLPADLAPPEEAASVLGSGEDSLGNDSQYEDEFIGAIRGTVINKITRAPLDSAQVRLVLSDRETVTATTDSAGKYSLEIPPTPDFFALSASLEEFVPQTRNIERAKLETKRKLVINFALEPESQSAMATEAAPDVHHLGDDRFSGDINSQFQKRSEGSKFSIGFQITPEILTKPLARAEVRLMAKGVQRRHKVFVNRQLLDRRLDEAPEDGGFGEFIAPFDSALLVAGVNTLRIEALPSTEDIDDFEFVNIRIYLVPQANPALGTDATVDPGATTTGTQ